MRTFLFILFSTLIGYLTKDIWLELNPWYYKASFLMSIILIPFILYSLAAEIALKKGWLIGIFVMIIITIIDNYFTNAISLCIISKCYKSVFDFSGFKLSFEILSLPWYSYVVSGIMGGITGAIGDRQRQIERERHQKTILLGVYLLAGQFLGMAVPELSPIISRVTPVVTTVLATETISKTGNIAIPESVKLVEKNAVTKTEPILNTAVNEATENVLKVRYFKYSYLKNGQKVIVEIPDFNKQSIFETKLPTNLYIASDEVQFAKSTSSFGEQIKANPKTIELLKSRNIEILKRDKIYYENNKINILNAQNKMLQATDIAEQTKWLKELRRLTNKITFILTPKGKPFVLLNEEQILAKQLKDISNPNSSSQSRIFGYVWHHSEKPGVMQLIPKDFHEYNRHIGGNAIWGGNLR